MRHRYIFGVLIAVVLSAIAASPHYPAEASAGGVITGWAWSDTVGWISLNCSDYGTCNLVNYGLSVNPAGNVTGYGWSENIGWVSANSADLVGCPAAPCSARIQDRVLAGWLKALSAGDGWDGWISLGGSGYSIPVGQGVFSGFGWGSDVIGWVDFSRVRTTYADACTPYNFCADGALYRKNADCTDTFTRTCQNGCADGSSCNTECTASTVYTCRNATTILRTRTNAQCAVTTHNIPCSPPSFCSSGSAVCLSPAPEFIPSDTYSGHLQAIPSLVPQGLTTNLFWNISNVTGCSVTGSNGTDAWTGTASPSGGQPSGPIDEQTTYTLSCTGLGGTDVNESVVVSVIPVFQEI